MAGSGVARVDYLALMRLELDQPGETLGEFAELSGLLHPREVVGNDASRIRTSGDGSNKARYPRTNHGLFDVPPTDPKALPDTLSWLRRHT